MTDQSIVLENPEIIRVDAQTTAVVADTVPMAEIGSFFERAFCAVAEVVARQGVTPTGAAFGYYPSMPTDTIDVEVGMVTDRPVAPEGEVVASELPAGEVAHAIYVGSYESLGAAYGELAQWIAAQGRQPAVGMWEVYLTEPTPETDPSSMRTELFWPLV